MLADSSQGPVPPKRRTCRHFQHATCLLLRSLVFLTTTSLCTVHHSFLSVRSTRWGRERRAPAELCCCMGRPAEVVSGWPPHCSILSAFYSCLHQKQRSQDYADERSRGRQDEGASGSSSLARGSTKPGPCTTRVHT